MGLDGLTTAAVRNARRSEERYVRVMSSDSSDWRSGTSARTVRVVAAVIERSGEYLITQRRATAVLPLLWEFPGGRVEADEKDGEALARELRHRLGVEIEVQQLISFVSHPYESYVVNLFLYQCALVGGEPSAVNVHAFRWVRSVEFDQFAFTPADERSMSKLLGV